MVIVEDDAGLRDQLVRVLRSAGDIECLYAVSSGEEAIEQGIQPTHVLPAKE